MGLNILQDCDDVLGCRSTPWGIHQMLEIRFQESEVQNQEQAMKVSRVFGRPLRYILLRKLFFAQLFFNQQNCYGLS
jgi:hypothetical protein